MVGKKIILTMSAIALQKELAINKDLPNQFKNDPVKAIQQSNSVNHRC